MKIDYVISWVDGQDPKHKAERKFYLEQEKNHLKGRLPNQEEECHGFEKTTQIRFQDNGELYYNIASVLLYAPFIRRIFIVTDGQVPAYIQSFSTEGKCPENFIHIVDHDKIFAVNSQLPQIAPVRPSFNSRAIETTLWRIPHLTEHFIFANDDFFFNAPAKVEDFFCMPGGIPRLRGDKRTSYTRQLGNFGYRFLEMVSGYRRRPSHRLSLWRGARLAGCKRYFLSVPHYPHPLRKSTFSAFFAANQQLLNKQLSFRFRSAQQFNPVSLANHLELQKGAKAEPPPNIAYLDEIKSPQSYNAFLKQVKTGDALYGCIQDMGLYPSVIQAELHKTLIKKFQNTLPQAVQSHLLTVLAEKQH